MTEPNITTPNVAECLSILESAAGPIVAAELAWKLRVSGSRETQRRYVRKIIEHLRNSGAWIVGDNRVGYFLTSDAKVWREYQERRQIEAKRTFGITHKRKKILADGKNQGVLFNMRTRCGVATCGPGACAN